MKPIATLLLCLTAASARADEPAPPEYETGRCLNREIPPMERT
jgi:hypothetical protein